MRIREEKRRLIRDRIDYWSLRLDVRPRIIRVQSMTKKWGSCSKSGIVTFAIDLAEQEPRFQDFVVAHELLHLRVPNHGKLFKALMTVHIPDWKKRSMEKQRVSKALKE